MLARRPLPSVPAPRGTAPSAAATVREAVLLALLAATSFLALRVDLGLLGAFRDLRDVGLFATASRWVEAAYVLPFGAMLALFPTLASERPGAGRLRRAAVPFAAAGLLGGAAVAAGALLLASRLYAGVGSEIAAIVVRLAPAAVPVSLSTLFGQALVARERTGLALTAAAISLTAHLTASLVLIPPLGPAGAAWAAVAGESVGAAAST